MSFKNKNSVAALDPCNMERSCFRKLINVCQFCIIQDNTNGLQGLSLPNALQLHLKWNSNEKWLRGLSEHEETSRSGHWLPSDQSPRKQRKSFLHWQPPGNPFPPPSVLWRGRRGAAHPCQNTTDSLILASFSQLYQTCTSRYGVPGISQTNQGQTSYQAI